MQSILGKGLLPGGLKEGSRSEIYFSITDPRNPRFDGGYSGQVALRPYVFRSEIVVIVDVKMARSMGVCFQQTASYAVLTDQEIPAECISRIVDWNSRELYCRRPPVMADAVSTDAPASGNAGQRESPDQKFEDWLNTITADKDNMTRQCKLWTERGTIKCCSTTWPTTWRKSPGLFKVVISTCITCTST